MDGLWAKDRLERRESINREELKSCFCFGKTRVYKSGNGKDFDLGKTVESINGWKLEKPGMAWRVHSSRVGTDRCLVEKKDKNEFGNGC